MTETRPSRWGASALIRLALVASLGLNLFFAGYWIGSTLNPTFQPPWPKPGRGPLHMIAERLRAKLSADGMSKIDKLVDDIEAHMRASMAATEPARQKLKASVAASPFEPEAFIAALGELSAGRTKRDEEAGRRIARTIAELTPEDRKVLADFILLLPNPPPR